jgi:hypothetical protein
MSDLQQILPTDYWEKFQIDHTDLEFLFNRLLELEEPQTIEELIHPLVSERLSREKKAFDRKVSRESLVYKPADSYKTGQVISFPAFQWKKGVVKGNRAGFNPQIPSFSVIEVEFEDKQIHYFAANLAEHKLNENTGISEGDFLEQVQGILGKYGSQIRGQLSEALETDPDLVRIAGCWFPKSLLLDINQGNLNLSEAILEEIQGGPLPTQNLVEQVEIPPNVNKKLVEFSMDYALQEDQRFDEVGPTGETLWFLKRLEPEAVQNTSAFLVPIKYEIQPEECQPALHDLEMIVEDEFSFTTFPDSNQPEIEFSLIFPHWRSGTLPLTEKIARFFPTAVEAPRIQFYFVDSETGERFPGWVVRPSSYVYGLQDYYTKHGLMPGSIIRLIQSGTPGEIKIHVEKRRQNREWVRTALIGADGGIVFATLKQIVTATFDERMAIAIPDVEAVDNLWKANRQKSNLDASLAVMAQELAKLNPQGHIHAQELYACANLVRRCPPGLIIQNLLGNSKYSSLGNLYFRISDGTSEGSDG